MAKSRERYATNEQERELIACRSMRETATARDIRTDRVMSFFEMVTTPWESCGEELVPVLWSAGAEIRLIDVGYQYRWVE